MDRWRSVTSSTWLIWKNCSQNILAKMSFFLQTTVVKTECSSAEHSQGCYQRWILVEVNDALDFFQVARFLLFNDECSFGTLRQNAWLKRTRRRGLGKGLHQFQPPGKKKTVV